MERIVNSLMLNYVFPDVYIGTIKEQTIDGYIYNTIFETNCRVKRETDGKWFVIAYTANISNRTVEPAIMIEWLKHSYQELYNMMIRTLIPIDSQIERRHDGRSMFYEDECQRDERERLEYIHKNKI